MEKKKKLIILGVILLLIIISGATFAILTWNSTMIKLGINTNCFTIDYTKGNNISGSLKLINEEDLISNNKFTIKEGVGVSSVNIGIKSTCSIEGYGNILLNITNISNVFTTGDSKGALKYAVLKNTSTITDPTQISTTSLLNQSFDIEKKGSITTSDTLKLLTKQLSNTELYKYIIVIYVDNNLAGNDVTEGTFTGNISADATQGKAPLGNAATYITTLYTKSDKTEVINNTITYNYATSVSLMNDRLGSMSTEIDNGNIRYYGASPNNYIYFNCDDYSNQTSDNCEVWRIIGVFEGKIKLIRNESIGHYSWDNKNANAGADNDFGKNDWGEARLMKLLNPSDYYEEDSNDNGNGQSIYWNGKSGTCFAGQNSTTKACDFTSIGLKNDTTRNMISETMYFLLGWYSAEIYSNQIYNYERINGKTWNESVRNKSWLGKIALPYVSDYGYAVDLMLCEKTLYNYEDSTCANNNWMFTSSYYQWLLTPRSSAPHGAFLVYNTGRVNTDYNVNVMEGIRPTLFLHSAIEINKGDGSSSNPYQLKVS